MATLVSLNVGLPKDVAWNGRIVHTGAWKAPVDGPRMVRRLNVDGDGQGDLGGHGGENRAVLVYQLDSYRYWAAELGRDDLAPGHFGENFTVDGLPDDEVCIGDRYRIGDAVFEVTQPRVTCYRVGLRMGVPNMAALLVSHRRPGFYLRVLTEGEVAAGQEIVKVAAGPEAVTVAEVDALLYLPGHPRDALERALRVPALSPGWKTSLREPGHAGDARTRGQHRTDRCGEQSAAGVDRLPAAASSPSIHDESADVRSLTLADPDGRRLPDWLPGQSITVRLRPEPRGHRGHPQLLAVQRAGLRRPTASASSGNRTAAAAGTSTPGSRSVTCSTSPRRAARSSSPTSDRPVLLLSAGVGITPVLSMLHALAESGSPREVWWLHGARDGAEHPFAAECRELLNRLPDSRSARLLQPARARRTGSASDYTATGRLSAEALDALGPPRDADAYLCGPADFMAALSAGLVEYGSAADRIHSETFGAAAALTPGIAATPSVRTASAGRSRRVRGPTSASPAAVSTVPWGPPYAEPARLRRGVRRAHPVVVPNRACATTARRPCCRDRSATTPNRSNRPRRATS